MRRSPLAASAVGSVRARLTRHKPPPWVASRAVERCGRSRPVAQPPLTLSARPQAASPPTHARHAWPGGQPLWRVGRAYAAALLLFICDPSYGPPRAALTLHGPSKDLFPRFPTMGLPLGSAFVSPPSPSPPLQNPQLRRFRLATATVGAPRTRLVRRAEAVRTYCFCLGTPLCLKEMVRGVSWSWTTLEELCFVWGGGRGGHGRMVCWVLPRHRLYGKEEIYSGRPPPTPRIKLLRRTRSCRQNEQRSSHSLVAEDRKTASIDANRIK